MRLSISRTSVLYFWEIAIRCCRSLFSVLLLVFGLGALVVSSGVAALDIVDRNCAIRRGFAMSFELAGILERIQLFSFTPSFVMNFDVDYADEASH